MVQQVTIPLSWANNIPGASGIDDVEFRVPELEDIETALDQAVPSLPEIETAVDDVIRTALSEVDVVGEQLDGLAGDIADEVDQRLDDLVDDIQTEIQQAVADIDVPGLEDVEVEVGGSLFAVNEDFIDLLAEALSQVDFLGVDQLDDLEGLRDDIETLLDRTEALADTTVDDVVQRATDEAEAFLADLPGGTLLLAPDEFVDDQIDRLTEDLISDEAREELEAAAPEDA